MNIIDKAVCAVNPEAGLKRIAARKRLEIVNSGYGSHGAAHDKKSVVGWLYGGGSHREDIEDHIKVLRQRSRDLYYGGSNIATGAIKRLRTNAVGIGLHLKSTIDEEFLGLTTEEARKLEETIEREFAHWAQSTSCDIERLDSFYQLQQLAFTNALLSGDAFALMTTTRRAGSIYDLRIRLIEADRISTPDNEIVNPLYCEGVEKNKAGEVIAYHISKFHPLSYREGVDREWTRVLAYGAKTGRRNILHIMNRERIGQVRGVPFISPVVETIKQLGRYSEAEVMAAVVSALFTIFIEKEGVSSDLPFGESIPEEMQVDSGDDNSIELAPGAVIDLGEGEKAHDVTPGRPNSNFDGFVIAIIKQIGAALEIPYEILIMAFNSNYSASRAAILEFFKTIRMYREWFIADFCQPIFEEWLCEAVAKGRINAPGFFSDPIIKDAYCNAEWKGPSAGQLDPVKEVTAAVMRVENGFSTRERETTELTGTNYYKNVKQRKREEMLLSEVNGNEYKQTTPPPTDNGLEDGGENDNGETPGTKTEE